MEKGFPQFYSPEKKESRELFRGTLGFDIIFVKDEQGNKKPYCIEINGEETGIFGFDNLPKGEMDETRKAIVATRAQYSEERMHKRRVFKELKEDFPSFNATPEGEKRIWEFIHNSTKSDPLIKFSFRNSEAIEEIASNKEKQQDFIPEECRPRIYQEGEENVSRSGRWLIKPKNGRGGHGIFVVGRASLQNFLEENDELTKSFFIIQEFLEAEEAENASPELKGRPASLRLLIDFQYLEDHTVKPIFEAAYQRVMPPSVSTPSYIVNKATGAVSVTASEEEKLLAHDLAVKIIQNLAGKYIQG